VHIHKRAFFSLATKSSCTKSSGEFLMNNYYFFKIKITFKKFLIIGFPGLEGTKGKIFYNTVDSLATTAEYCAVHMNI
jgi:hypothetical protein